MTNESREQLSNFVERADRIERSAYLKKVIAQGGTKVTFNWTKSRGGGYTTNFPDEEAIDALILTARMFVQDNDPISFRNMTKLEDDPEISDGFKERLRDVRNGLNGFLDAGSFLMMDGKRYSYREVFDIFVYGHLAHSNKAKAKLFRLWSRNPLGFPMVEQTFQMAVCTLVGAVRHLAQFCRKELAGEHIPPIPTAQGTSHAP